MLYLEDYLEMIENLPMEMRDRFTDMREMDLQVQNAMDSLDDRVKNFFKKCQTTPTLKQEWKDEQMEKIKQEYYKALEDADEKVQQANQIYELVDRHLRKLDQEVQKFKMELEADNAGITEVLEKRSLDLDIPPPGSRPEKRKHSSMTNSNHVEKKISTEKMFSTLAHEAARAAIGQHSGTPTSGPNSQNSLSYSLGMDRKGHAVANTNAAIAAAASQAIAATQQMQQGRRTSSLKASYEAMTKKADLTKEFSLGKPEGTTASSTWAAPSTPQPETKPVPKTKKQSSRTAAAAQPQQPAAEPPPPPEEPLPAEAPTAGGDPSNSATWSYDPNEPRYCICNEVSYGDMIGCDNEDCPIEWFHYGCVGLTQAPKGKWFCPECTAAMKRRGRK